MKMKPWIVVLALTPWIVGCGGAADDEAITEPSVAEHAHGEHNAHGHADDGSHSESGSHGGSHSESDSHGGSHSESGSHDGSHRESGSHGGSHSDHPVAEQPLPSGSKRPAAVQPKVKVKNGDGETAFSIKWKDDGAKMVDGQEQELARYNVSPGKMKVKDPDDQVLAYLVGLPSGGRVKVKDASQEKELFKLIRQDDGECVVPGYNAPIQETFEPGSVLKILAAAAAIEMVNIFKQLD